MRGFKKIERFRVEKNAFKKYWLYYSRSVHWTNNKQIAKPKITPLEKRQFRPVLKGLKQGIKVQDKEEYLAFTAK